MLSSIFKEILNGWVQATQEQFNNHPIANKLRRDLKDSVQEILSDRDIEYIVKASPGAGNWASVPWLSILDPRITETTQEGIYPVYLFRADGTGVYLSLGLGTTRLKERFGATQAKIKAKKIAERIYSITPQIKNWAKTDIDLRASTDLGRSYEWGTAGAIFYPAEEIPSTDVLINDLNELLNIYNNLPSDIMDDVDENNMVDNSLDKVSIPKPFLLLAGLSGTGKTRFVREQAQSPETYCPVSVRPDWHEPSDLLGYVSRLSGKPEYVTTKVLDFIISAWRVVTPDADARGAGELDLSVAPYWLCLDEMNLAPVEQYFADYLSVLESRKFRDDGVYECDPLLDSGFLKRLQADGNPQKDLGLQGDDDLWAYFLEYGIAIPPNLIVAGTVNMDETTHGFSRKVIDRAFTFDFGEFFPNDYAQFFEPDIKPVIFTYPQKTQAVKSDLAGTVDSDGGKTIRFLESLNSLLKSTPFELAYRALNEALLQVICFNPQTDAELQAVWDDFLMSKVLPRIDGDEDKLTIKKDNEARNLLTELAVMLENELSEIWAADRKDFFRVYADGTDITGISCRTKAKLVWMSGRLEMNTFTSFWP